MNRTVWLRGWMLWLGLALLLGGCSPELGQLGGVVTSANGVPLGFAQVRLGTRETRTNAQGQYLFADVPPGHHQLNAQAQGFLSHDAVLEVRPGAQRLDLILNAQPPAPEAAAPFAQAPSLPQPTPVTPVPAAPEVAEPRAEKPFVPDFKLPLPGERDWLLSTEPGGRFYGGEPDAGHSGRSYYSLDLIDNNRQQGELNGFPVPILAAADGVVTETRNSVICQGCQFGYGNYVKIDHGGGFSAIYGHLRYPSVTVRAGQRVRQGQVLGFMGSTGHSTGIHLHFEIRHLDEGARQSTVLGTLHVDGRALSQYKVGTVAHPIYYRSTQRAL